MSYDTDLQLFIDGVWKSGEGRDAHPVVNPVTASAIAEVPYATEHDLEEALAAADRAWPEWRSTDVEKRGAILHKVASLLRERADHIGAILTQEQGKILPEAKAEVMGSAQLFDWYAEEIKRDYGRTLVRPAGQLSRVIRQPVGPVATFTLPRLRGRVNVSARCTPDDYDTGVQYTKVVTIVSSRTRPRTASACRLVGTRRLPP